MDMDIGIMTSYKRPEYHRKRQLDGFCSYHAESLLKNCSGKKLDELVNVYGKDNVISLADCRDSGKKNARAPE